MYKLDNAIGSVDDESAGVEQGSKKKVLNA